MWDIHVGCFVFVPYFWWDSEIIETPAPSPAKKKQAYVVVSSFIYALLDRIVAVIAPQSQLRLLKRFLLFQFRASFCFDFAFFLAHSFHYSDLVLAAMKKRVYVAATSFVYVLAICSHPFWQNRCRESCCSFRRFRHVRHPCWLFCVRTLFLMG